MLFVAGFFDVSFGLELFQPSERCSVFVPTTFEFFKLLNLVKFSVLGFLDISFRLKLIASKWVMICFRTYYIEFF